MTSIRGLKVIGPWMLLLVLWGSAFSLACYLVSEEPELAKSADSVLEQLLGASRTALSESLYETADLYFHKGVPHQTTKAFDDSFFQKVREAVAPSPHVHPDKAEIDEIIPWLRFSTKMDPHNVEAYLVASYWVGDRGGRPDLAKSILEEARILNPGNYQIYSEIGRNFILLEEAERASDAFDKGIVLWPSSENQEERETQLQLARMISYRAFLYELSDDDDSALRLFHRAQKMFPEDDALKRRIQSLERGESSKEWAEEAWRQLFPRSETCAREHHSEGHAQHLGSDGKLCHDPSHHHEQEEKH